MTTNGVIFINKSSDLPEIENDPQKMNSASLNIKLFSVIILTALTLMGNKKNCVRHQIKKVLTISGIWRMSFLSRPSWIYIKKKVGIPEIVSDDRLLHFKPSNLISVSPTTPSNDFHVSRSLAKSPLRCSCVVVFELELDLEFYFFIRTRFITS